MKPKPSALEPTNSANPGLPNSTLPTSLQTDGISKKLMVTEVTWICPICFFSNTLPADFPTSSSIPVQRRHLPVCLTCGIQATAELITKSIQSAIALPASSSPPPLDNLISLSTPSPSPSSSGVACPRCTFVNHPSMNFCEICGARIVSPNLPPQLNTIMRQSLGSASLSTSSSSSSLVSMSSTTDHSNFMPEIDNEGYLKALTPTKTTTGSTTIPASQVFYKLSFRSGGEKPVYEQLKVALAKKVWEVKKPAKPKAESNSLGHKNIASSRNDPIQSENRIAVGIHGLQLVGEQQRQQNQEVLGEALEDLNALMARAKEVVKLAEDYSKYLEKQEANSNTEAAAEAAKARKALQYSTQALGLLQTTGAVTKDNLADETLYHSELARQLAEFLADNSATGEPGVLSREGGVITLFDLFAVYNRARGVSLVSPRDLQQACDLLADLKLPITLRTFNSGLQVVQESYRTPDVIIRNLLELIHKKEREHSGNIYNGGDDDVLSSAGISAIHVSNKLKWSVMISTEELELAEQRGVLCRDEQLSGTTFYENKIPEVPWNWKAEIFGE